MRYAIHPEAASEFERAGGYYRQIRSELGQRYEDDFDETLDRMLNNPEAWHPMGRGYRRCSFDDFPFGIIYRLDKKENRCLIYAVMHFKQRPVYWKNRKF